MFLLCIIVQAAAEPAPRRRGPILTEAELENEVRRLLGKDTNKL